MSDVVHCRAVVGRFGPGNSALGLAQRIQRPSDRAKLVLLVQALREDKALGPLGVVVVDRVPVPFEHGRELVDPLPVHVLEQSRMDIARLHLVEVGLRHGPLDLVRSTLKVCG